MRSSLKLFALKLSLLAINAEATDGYFAHGYGVKSQGMDGVGIALPQDAVAAASNPAAKGQIGDRMDFGVTCFRPRRESEIRNSFGSFADGTYKANDTENFLIPEFGYNRQINPNLTFGLSEYGNGGMNTDYKKSVPLLCNTLPGVNLIQLFVAPAVTWKINETNTIGVSVNLAYQRFEETVRGSYVVAAGFGGGDVNLSMYQNSLGIAYGWKL